MKSPTATHLKLIAAYEAAGRLRPAGEVLAIAAVDKDNGEGKQAEISAENAAYLVRTGRATYEPFTEAQMKAHAKAAADEEKTAKPPAKA